jgi:hypothetical protein
MAGCAQNPKPATVIKGECRVFEAPEYAVKGLTRDDQDWIDVNTEAGIAACQWKRPHPRPVVAKPIAPKPPVPTKAIKKHWWQRGK